ncbi:hypothetical protein K8Q93_00700 [Candidatus Parcubacteria bacterium]|nr:hypothetical protein [Candidatus Parcubacteria bacterium]
MNWNSLTVSQKTVATFGTVAVVFGLVALVAYAMGVRCTTEGSFIACSREVASETPMVENENTSAPLETGSNVSPLSESDDRPEPISVDGDVIVVNDQPAGPIVEVTMLTLSQPGWVAVYEDRDGTPGNVLGAARFEEGMHLGEISLLRSTEANHPYYVILHGDTASRDFDLKKNPLVIGMDGVSIRSTFRTFSD